MSTTPPEPGAHEAGAGTGGSAAGAGGAHRGSLGTLGSSGDIARIPIPGNAEFLFLIVAIIVLALVAAIADAYDVNGWVTSLEILGAAYIISRGVAKASRVLEH